MTDHIEDDNGDEIAGGRRHRRDDAAVLRHRVETRQHDDDDDAVDDDTKDGGYHHTNLPTTNMVASTVNNFVLPINVSICYLYMYGIWLMGYRNRLTRFTCLN